MGWLPTLAVSHADPNANLDVILVLQWPPSGLPVASTVASQWPPQWPPIFPLFFSIFREKEEITYVLLSFTYNRECAKSLQKMGGHWGGHWEATGEAIGRPLGGHCLRIT